MAGITPVTPVTPQQTGLGSRNPFLPLVTPQTTGLSETSIHPPPNSEHGPPLSQSPPTPPPKNQAPENLPKLEQQLTGALNSMSISPSSAPPRISIEGSSLSPTRTFSPPTGPPPQLPPRSTSTTSNTSNRPPTPTRNSTLDILQEELPPEYTPGPNAYAGEQSIDFGPLRPFQNTSQPAQRPPVQPTGSNAYSSQQQFRSPSGSSGSLRQALGSLILAALTEPPRDRNSYSTSPALGRGLTTYGGPIQPRPPAAPYGASRSSVPSTSRGGWSQYPGQRQRSLTPEPQPSIPDDGKPTTRPTPGHPLLRDGKVLVYPLGHECRKCFNKGFRPVHASTFDATPRALAPGDPSHPCKRCWRHHSRLYNSTLAQLDWKDAVDTNFQRPISDPDVVSRSILTSGPIGAPRGLTSPPIGVRSPPLNFGIGPPGPLGGRGQPPLQWRQTTPVGEAMYEPGDPRLGGRLCPRCHGTGRTRVFILETETCNLCGGVGRVF
jgi:hypothetical protein